MSEEPTEITEEEEGESSRTAGFVLTEDDRTIFKLIYDYRFLRREHLCMLTGRSEKRLHRRLLILIKQRYLKAIRLPQQKHIYALAKRAVPVMVEEGIADPILLTERLRTHELKPLFLKHEMMLVDLHVMLSLATREGHLRLISWREGRELFDWVTVSDGGRANKLPIRPDAFFTLEDFRRPQGANRGYFFLEADRSTSNQTRFKEKMIAYWHYLGQGLHEKKYGIKNFRVLTITLTEARAANLCTLASTLLPAQAHAYYLFASLTKFSLDNPAPLLQDVYLSPRTAGTDTRHPLVPAPKPTLMPASAAVG